MLLKPRPARSGWSACGHPSLGTTREDTCHCGHEAALPALEANHLVDRLPAATGAADLRSECIEANRPFVVEAGGALASWSLNAKWATKGALLAAHGGTEVFVSMLPTPDGSLDAADLDHLETGRPASRGNE